MKKKHFTAITLLLLTAGFLTVTAVSCGFFPEDEDDKLDLSGMKLVWSDEFDSGSTKTAPSTSNWTAEIWEPRRVNNEEQAYINSTQTAYVSDGTLKIRAIKSGTWKSARLKTEDADGTHSWKYGYFEARMKMPKGKGVWPAFWMMPHDPTGKSGDGAYGTWPRSGELDILEFSPGTTGNKVYSTVHHSMSSTEASKDSYSSLGSKVFDDASSAWHTYGLRWTESYVEAFYDGESLGTSYYNGGYNSPKGWTSWPYDQKFYIILNLAMGGNLGGSIDSSLTEAVLEVDYVRVYQ